MDELVLHTIHVGLGERGRRLLAALHRSEFFVPIAVVDPDPDARSVAQELSDLSDAECFETLTEAIYASDADAVVLAAPAGEHRDLLLEALAADLHVLVTPPLTSTLEDANRCVFIAQNRGVKLMVAARERYSPEMCALTQLINADELGEVLVGELALPEPCSLSSSTCVEALDVALAVLGMTPISVCRDEAFVTVTLSEGPELRCSFRAADSEGPILRVFGSQAAADYRPGSVSIRSADGAERPLPQTSGSPEYGEDLIQLQFHAWVRHGVEPPTSARKHLVVLELLDAIRRVRESGETVTLSR